MYEDKDSRRFIEISGEHEPELEPATEPGEPASSTHLTNDGRRVSLADLLAADLIRVGEVLEWYRPRTSKRYQATVNPDGSLRLPDGRTFSTPSRAAVEAVGAGSYDGWHAWRTQAGVLLHHLRKELLQTASANPQVNRSDEDQQASPSEDGSA